MVRWVDWSPAEIRVPSPLGAGAELLLVTSTSEMVLSLSSLLKEFRLKSESGKERKLAL